MLHFQNRLLIHFVNYIYISISVSVSMCMICLIRFYVGNVQECGCVLVHLTCMQEIRLAYHLSHMVCVCERPSILCTGNVDDIPPLILHHFCHKEWYRIYDLSCTSIGNYRKMYRNFTLYCIKTCHGNSQLSWKVQVPSICRKFDLSFTCPL